MNIAMKNQIISELDNLPDQEGHSLLDYLHFLKQEVKRHYPNTETIEAIKELENDTGELKTYTSAADLFDELGIEK